MKARVNNVELSYVDQGSGIPLLLVHGFPLNKSMWSTQVRSLARDFRVIALDLRGHGESAVPPGTYTMDLLADDLLGLLDRLRIRHVVLAGFSMGGYTAFAFYRKYADRVQALILADTRPQPDTPEAKQGRENTAQTALREGVAGIAQGLIPRMLAPSTVQQRPKVVDRVRQIMLSTSVNGYVGDLRGLAQRPDSTPTLARITCPTLVIVGDQDALTPPADAQLMAKAIPHASLKVIAKAGHLSPIEQPRAFNLAVRSFVGALNPAGQRGGRRSS